MKLVPRRYCRRPRARDADDRLTGRVRHRRPVLETPARNLRRASSAASPSTIARSTPLAVPNLPWQSNDVND